MRLANQFLALLFIFQLNWFGEITDAVSPHQNSTNAPKLSVAEIARLELEQFELEKDAFILELQHEGIEQVHNGRVKRTVLYNSEAPLDVVLVFAIPLTVLLPVLTNVFNNLNWSKIFKWKRSVDNLEEEVYDEDSSIVQPHLDKLSGYFELMRV